MIKRFSKQFVLIIVIVALLLSLYCTEMMCVQLEHRNNILINVLQMISFQILQTIQTCMHKQHDNSSYNDECLKTSPNKNILRHFNRNYNLHLHFFHGAIFRLFKNLNFIYRFYIKRHFVTILYCSHLYSG